MSALTSVLGYAVFPAAAVIAGGMAAAIRPPGPAVLRKNSPKKYFPHSSNSARVPPDWRIIDWSVPTLSSV